MNLLEKYNIYYRQYVNIPILQRTIKIQYKKYKYLERTMGYT